MSEHPTPGESDWPQWATLCNDVSEAVRTGARAPERMWFSERTAIAQGLWDAGYRPTPDAVLRAIARQAS